MHRKRPRPLQQERLELERKRLDGLGLEAARDDRVAEPKEPMVRGCAGIRDRRRESCSRSLPEPVLDERRGTPDDHVAGHRHVEIAETHVERMREPRGSARRGSLAQLM